MAQFEFKCPQCGESTEADDSICGQVAECPYCGKEIVVPRGNTQTGISQGKEALSQSIHAEESGQKEITTKCPHCGTMYEVEQDYLGRKALCETCGRNFVIAGIESAVVALDTDITAQESVEDRTDGKRTTTTFGKAKTLATMVTARAVAWWKNGKEGRKAFCSKMKTATITAKDKTGTLWKCGTKGKVVICGTILLVICILIPLFKSRKSNSLARIEQDSTSQSSSRKNGHTAEDGILAENGKYKVGDYTWTYSISNGNATIKSVMPETGNITIPSKIGKYSVTAIGNWAFLNHHLTSVSIPDSVTSIGDSAFKGCNGLTSVTLPDSVTCVQNDTFSECGRLTSITIPNSVTNIGDRAFFKCGSLKSLAIPNSVTSIGLFAFKGCTNLMSVTGGGEALCIFPMVHSKIVASLPRMTL